MAENVPDYGLLYMRDDRPGIMRRRAGKGFVYLTPERESIKDTRVLARIRTLAIPPAWREVWISSSSCGHVQATGRDARGRKQYIYHPQWRLNSATSKFSRLIPFGYALPGIRARTERDLAFKGLPRPKVLAVVVRLLEATLIRIGNREYVRENNSYGLSTLRQDQITVEGGEIFFHFHGKSGKEHALTLRDGRLARLIRRLQDIPGQELFQYYDDEGKHREVESADVNAYLRAVSGDDFSAKDFRTWGGTCLAAAALREMGPADAGGSATKKITEAVRYAAERLGNRPSICGRYYIHPAVPESFLKGELERLMNGKPADAEKIRLELLSPAEQGVLALLEQFRPEPAEPAPACTES